MCEQEDLILIESIEPPFEDAGLSQHLVEACVRRIGDSGDSLDAQ